MKFLSKLMIGLIAISMIAISCEKGGDDLEPNGNENQNTELPTNENEAFELVTKKWDLPQLADYNSIELTKDSLFIVDKVSALKSTNEGSEIITGTFTINSDGVTIILNGFGTMTIEQVNDNLIVITIVLNDGTNLGSTDAEEDTTILDDKTSKICKTWCLYVPAGDCSNSIVADWTFYQSGFLAYDGLTCDPASNIPSSAPVYSNWNWTDENQNNITVVAFEENGEVVDYTFSFDIISITENQLITSMNGSIDTLIAKSTFVNPGGDNNNFTENQLIGLWRYEYNDENDTIWTYELNFYSDKHVTFYTSESGNTYEIGTWSFDDNLVTITSTDGNDSSTGTINTDNTLTITVGSLENAIYTKVE